MQINEKELERLEDPGVFYADGKFIFICDHERINLRKDCNDLAEFKRRILDVKTDKEVRELYFAFIKYCRLEGYLQFFGIKDAN
jgi:hypothetical protein